MQAESTVFLYADYFAGSFIRIIRVGKISVKSALNVTIHSPSEPL